MFMRWKLPVGIQSLSQISSVSCIQTKGFQPSPSYSELYWLLELVVESEGEGGHILEQSSDDYGQRHGVEGPREDVVVA